jgi:hypothetical protein
MLRTIVAAALAIASFTVQAQPTEDCTNMANRWSDIFTNAPALDTMTDLFTTNALVFGTNSKELGVSTSDVSTYFTPVYGRKPRTKNSIKFQRAIPVADGVWVITGLYDFINMAADGTQTVTPARFHFVVVREGKQCKIAAFNSSRVPG